MTIRDLLCLNTVWYSDRIQIRKIERHETLLSERNTDSLHPAWLDFEIAKFIVYPSDPEDPTNNQVTFDITITGEKVLQDKQTVVDVNLNERIRENESTNYN